MIVYSYNLQGEFIAAITLNAGDRNPFQPDGYLIPARCTTISPPNPQTGFALVWNGNAWTQVEDHRGEIWYDAQGNQVQIIEIGEVPAGLSQTKPLPSLEQVKTEAKRAIIAFADSITSQIESAWTSAEVKSWPTREAEVRLYRANQSASVAPLLAASAHDRGIQLPDYIEIVDAYATAYKAITVRIEKYRVNAWHAIESATSVETVNSIVETAKNTLMLEIQTIQSGGT
jgi:hypothetical protein